MKLVVIERGTHFVPVKHWNNDVLSPCSVVAETLSDLEYHIGAMVKDGGNDPETLACVQYRVASLFETLKSASLQEWKLTLEGYSP